ncbi:MAG: PIN domain-containing protein [Fimbriimonadales bacterium]|nr:PIN domain-containing protein [Fimbriimonadales bacterium]
MKYLLDTNTWSYLQQGHPQVVARVTSLPAEAQLFLSVISQGELLAGIEWAQGVKRKRQLRLLYEQVIHLAAEVVPVSEEVAVQYARIWAHLRRSGRPIPSNDVWLAATAIAGEMTLVTADQHFSQVPNLKVENWLE